MKSKSVFYRKDVMSRIRNNAAESNLKELVIQQAGHWMRMELDELYGLIFPSCMQRSPMVFSSGWCPGCKKPVGGYGWVIDILKHPWKVKCPVCGELFPKNDFKTFYDSGRDEHGLFKYVLSDKRLLFNTEHPDINDPLHKYGVDDGFGYCDGGNTWYFIPLYLLTGVWEKQIFGGIINLSDAYVMTGEIDYARKAAVLMDRLADVFPEFDYTDQAVINEEHRTSRGYVSYWCTSAYEVLRVALAYDSIFEAIRDDEEFISYAVYKAGLNDPPVKKHYFNDIQQNIEERLLLDPIKHRWKIESNRPRTEFAIMAVKAVISWPENREEVLGDLWRILDLITVADGLSGEKGLAAYSSLSAFAMSNMISCMNLLDNDIFELIMKKYPGIHDGFRFFIDSICLGKFYPGCGDMGHLSDPCSCPVYFGWSNYESSNFYEKTVLYSYEGFIWDLYKYTDDPDLVKFLYNASVEQKKFDMLFESAMTMESSPKEMRKMVEEVVERSGRTTQPKSINRETWKLAVCHSGNGEDERAISLDYDSGGYHGHNDCMNMSIFAKGMNMLPDYGYPPYHRKGGWGSAWFFWYRSASSHNTVIVDRKEHADFLALNERDYDRKKDPIGYYNYVKDTYTKLGKSRIWAVGSTMKAIGASCPETAGVRAYMRTLVMVDVSDSDSYIIDVFRVEGGNEHIKLIRSSYSSFLTDGISPGEAENEKTRFGIEFIKEIEADRQIIKYDFENQGELCFTRNIRKDRNPQKGWSAVWKMENIFSQKTGGKDIYLNYRDFTSESEAWLYEARFDVYSDYVRWCPEKLNDTDGFPDEWLPAVAVVRKGEDLSSAFAGIFEPYQDKPFISYAKRLDVYDKNADERNDMHTAFEISANCGIVDLVIVPDLKDCNIIQKDWNVETDAALCLIRKRDGRLTHLSVYKGSYIIVKGRRIDLITTMDIQEIEL